MRYIIYGAGGIGGVIGGRLFHHGYKVVLICRGDQLTTIQRQGLTLKTPDETWHLSLPAVGHPAEIAFTEDDVVLFTMKSQDTEMALRDLYRTAGSEVPVVCAQNGVDNERMAARRFTRVYGMVVWVPGTYLEPGIVLNHATPIGGILDAGRYPTGVDALITQVTADLTACGFSARPDPHIMRWKYTKLLSNIRNALQAACGLEVRAPEFVRALREEALACYRAAGIDFVPEDELQQRVRSQIKLADIDGHPRSGGSSWQSLMRGLPTIEADFLNGEIVLLGTLYGIPTPYNRLLQRVANHMAQTGQPPGSVSIEALQQMLSEYSHAQTPGS
jgi:2-dehydropantoate 2-reductase